MKKIITIFFLLVLGIQILPIKAMGKTLYDNNFVEEEVCKKEYFTPQFTVQDVSELMSPPFAANNDFFLDLCTPLSSEPFFTIEIPPPNL